MKLFTTLAILLSATNVYAIPSGHSNTPYLDQFLDTIPPDGNETPYHVFDFETLDQVDTIPSDDNETPNDILGFETLKQDDDIPPDSKEGPENIFHSGTPYHGDTIDTTGGKKHSPHGESNFASFDELLGSDMMYDAKYPAASRIMEGVSIKFYISLALTILIKRNHHRKKLKLLTNWPVLTFSAAFRNVSLSMKETLSANVVVLTQSYFVNS